MITGMFKRLRRWHFDLALFLGLAIFSWAYWYTKPRPVWTNYYALKDNGARNNSLSILGYSADSQSIYTTCETTEFTKNLPIPQIQRWSTQTGELLEDYPVELPEEDRFLLKLPRQHFGSSFTLTLCNDPQYFQVRYHQSSKQEHHYMRLYRINGKPVAKGLELNQFFSIDYVTQPPGSEHYWALFFERVFQKRELPISLIDLDTGKPIRTYQSAERDKLESYPTFSSGRYLAFVTQSIKNTSRQMEVIDLQTGESIGQISIPNGTLYSLAALDESHLAACLIIGDYSSFTTHVEIYRKDPEAKTLRLDASHPLNGRTSVQNQWIWIQAPYLVTVSNENDQHKDSIVMKTIQGWLARIGIVRDDTRKNNFHIADLATGQPLRQVSRFSPHCSPSPEWRYIVADTSGPNDQPGLCLYVIPHYLWESTLSWMQWLSWLLVIPWPLRYFVQPQLAPGFSSKITSPAS